MGSIISILWIVVQYMALVLVTAWVATWFIGRKAVDTLTPQQLSRRDDWLTLKPKTTMMSAAESRIPGDKYIEMVRLTCAGAPITTEVERTLREMLVTGRISLGEYYAALLAHVGHDVVVRGDAMRGLSTLLLVLGVTVPREGAGLDNNGLMHLLEIVGLSSIEAGRMNLEAVLPKYATITAVCDKCNDTLPNNFRQCESKHNTCLSCSEPRCGVCSANTTRELKRIE